MVRVVVVRATRLVPEEARHADCGERLVVAADRPERVDLANPKLQIAAHLEHVLERGLELRPHLLHASDARHVVGAAVVHEARRVHVHLVLVRLHPCARAEQALLLATPQHEADRATRLGADRHQDARSLHRRRRARAVVGGAARAIPTIDVPADDDVFVGLLRSANVGDHVELRDWALAEVVLHVELDFDRLAFIEQRTDLVELRLEQSDHGRARQVLPIHARVAARLHEMIASRCNDAEAAVLLDRVRDLGQHRCRHVDHPRTLDLVAHRGEFGLVLRRREHRAASGAARSCAPRIGAKHEFLLDRRLHAAPPRSAVEADRHLAPLLEPRVREPHRRKRIARPFACNREVVRRRKPRPDAIDEMIEMRHHARLLEALLLDRLELRGINLREQRRRGAHQREQRGTEVHGREP